MSSFNIGTCFDIKPDTCVRILLARRLGALPAGLAHLFGPALLGGSIASFL
jgi:hypothetical protein